MIGFGADNRRRALNLLLDAARERLRASAFDDALDLLRERDEVIAALGLGPQERSVVEGWLVKAEVRRAVGGLEEATRWVQPALETAREHGWIDLEAKGLAIRAQTQRHLGDLELAERFTEQALDLYLLMDDREGIADTIMSLAFVQRMRGRLPESIELYHANMLPCCVYERDEAAWQVHLSQTSELLTQTAMADVDIAISADTTGRLWAEHGGADAARAAYDLALGQWSALGNHEAVERVQATRAK